MSTIAPFMRLTMRSQFTTEDRAQSVLDRPKRTPKPPFWLGRRVDISRSTINGFPVFAVDPKRTQADAAQPGSFIYLHGSAYISPIHPTHWGLIADIATTTQRRVLVPLYGLAPHHDVTEAIAFVQAVLQETAAHGPTYLMGDSAGGGLALAATLAADIETGAPIPVGLTLISPWLDITLSHPDIEHIAPRDPCLSVVGLRVCGRAWAHGISLDDPVVSPINGDLTHLPPTDLYIGDRDIFLPDSRKLRDIAPPGTVTYHEEPGAIHCHPLIPAPEGRRARAALLASITTAFDQAPPT